MNIGYKILWIEDSETYYESTVGIIKDLVRRNNMIPEIKYYEHYQEFQETELDKFDHNIFNLYDQLIIDYALSGEGKTGDTIIRDLRKKRIFTDIIFYSSNFEIMQTELRNESQLDGVFFADRNDLTMAVDNVIKKNLKREYNIANIRGLIMDSTSDFDYVCRITTLTMFNKLSPDSQEMVVQKAREYMSAAQDRLTGNFSAISKKAGYGLIEKAINSVDYVMENNNRYKLMSIILKEFDFNIGSGEEFSEEYRSKIITPRNELAHNKLFYGECKKKIQIAKKRQALVCNKDCENCTGKYDIDSCEKLRKLLFEYYQIFSSINDEVMRLVSLDSSEGNTD